MILVDTSIWVHFIRAGDSSLTSLLNDANVLIHPFVIGELAVGNLRDREHFLSELKKLTFTALASDSEVLEFVDWHRLYGLGIGYVDCHLLASVMLTPGGSFWTRDKRLFAAARPLGVATTLPESPHGAKS